jgi:hypothetical protein
MDATLVLHFAVNALAFDQSDDFLEATDSGRTGGHDIHSPVLPFGISRIHAKHIGDKQPSFIAAGSGTNFENDIAFVVRILRQQQQLQIGLAHGEALIECRQFLFGHRLHFGIEVGLAKHGLGVGETCHQRLVFGILRSNFAVVAVRFRDLLIALAVGCNFRVGELQVQFFVFGFNRTKLVFEKGIQAHRVSASSSATIAVFQLRIVRLLCGDALKQHAGIVIHRIRLRGMFC